MDYPFGSLAPSGGAPTNDEAPATDYGRILRLLMATNPATAPVSVGRAIAGQAMDNYQNATPFDMSAFTGRPGMGREAVDRQVEAAAPLAMSAMGSGVPFAPKGAAGIFGGRLAADTLAAKGIDQPSIALKMADHMQAQGATKEDIYGVTSKMLEGTPYAGVSKGAEGKWRFEIPDNDLYARKGYGAGLNPLQGETFGKFDPKIEHELLTNAYPGKFDYLAHDVNIARGNPVEGRFMPEGAGRNEEFFYGDKPVLPTLFVTAPTTRQARSVAAHELQHAVQGEERFARGSNPDLASENIYNETNTRLSDLARRMDTASGADKVTLKAEYDRLMDQRSNIDRYDLYKRSAGEVEARNVQTRLKMTPEQRRATPPWTTQDVPLEQQIVRQGVQPPFGALAY